MTPISCTPEAPGWRRVQIRYRRRYLARTAWTIVRDGLIVAVVAGVTWYVAIEAALDLL